MEKKLMAIINDEDKKNPYTDEEIAKKLSIARTEVIKLRRQMKIGDSRDRRMPFLLEEATKIMQQGNEISERNLTQMLNDKGFNISRNIVSKLIKELSKSSGAQIKHSKQSAITFQDAFSKIIGSQGYLKPQIELAKAAILYPNNGLHTLIYGETGVGKTELAEAMYQFAIQSQIRSKETPFVVFNCADYAENPQLLLAQLFGYVKGAFTGADVNKDGLVEKANGGILFLDEIHRLPAEGQEILFYLIDKGRYRRLGETNIERSAKVMIIAATTEDIESSLLTTFRRRIPMLIEIPNLSKRPLSERLEIIKNFFKNEATRMNVGIKVSFNVVAALLLYQPSGNVGQLRSDIQVVCARAFLNYMINKNEIINIEITDLPSQVVKGLLKFNQLRQEVEKLIVRDLEILPNEDSYEFAKEATYMFPKEIYKEIEEKYYKMHQQGYDGTIINQILGDMLEVKISQLIKEVRHNKHNLIKQDLEKIVGKKIVAAVEEMIKIAKVKIKDIDESLFYCLATHLSASYERITQNKKITNPELQNIKIEYPMEYSVAEELTQIASYHLQTTLPEDEIAFIAMYLKSYSKSPILDDSNVGIVVLTHGQVAEGLVGVANRLLGVNHAKAMEMSLDEPPDNALERAIELVNLTDKGKGVLLLVDMGSLVGFGNIISERTGIKTRTITKVEVTMVIEAVRKALLPDSDLNEIADTIINSREVCSCGTNNLSKNKPNAILSLCFTGKGAEKVAHNIINKYLPDFKNKVEIISVGALAEKSFESTLNEIKNKRNILAIVGTFNPGIKSFPFISVKELFSGEGITRLKYIAENAQYDPMHQMPTNQLHLSDLFTPGNVLLKQRCENKTEVLNKLGAMMYSNGHVTEKYISSVHEREILAPTFLNNQVGLPHGEPEEVLKPAIGIMTLEKPVDWGDGNKVRIVFLLALNNYSKEGFTKLYKILNDKSKIEMMLRSASFDQLMEVLLNYE